MRVLDPYDVIDMGVVGWIDWADAYIKFEFNEVRIPCMLITGERCEIKMTQEVIEEHVGDETLQEYLDKKRLLGNNVGVYGG